jgi:hypothetical protein
MKCEEEKIIGTFARLIYQGSTNEINILPTGSIVPRHISKRLVQVGTLFNYSQLQHRGMHLTNDNST